MTKFTAKADTRVAITVAENIIVECAFCKNLFRSATVRTQNPDSPPRINPKIG